MTTTTYLFWNLNGKDLTDRLLALVVHHRIDVLLLAECSHDPARLSEGLKETVGSSFRFPRYVDPNSSTGLQLHYRTAMRIQFHERFRDPLKRFVIFGVVQPRRPDGLVVLAHLPSPLYRSLEDQALFARLMVEQIVTEEEKVGHSRTLVSGDFNMDPFEGGIVGADGFHAVMSRDQARKRQRTVFKKPYQYFYNPMWGLFGDRSDGPPGTYYYSNSGRECQFWHIFDQVLLRPDIMDHLIDLRILDSDGHRRLINDDGRPDRDRASDHLPILFRVDHPLAEGRER